jgi:hypothetical protein
VPFPIGVLNVALRHPTVALDAQFETMMISIDRISSR